MDNFCYFGRRTATKTSWTYFNPGRRFMAHDNHEIIQVVASCIKTGDRIGDKQIKGEDASGLLVWIIPRLLHCVSRLETELETNKSRVRMLRACLFGSWLLIIVICCCNSIQTMKDGSTKQNLKNGVMTFELM